MGCYSKSNNKPNNYAGQAIKCKAACCHSEIQPHPRNGDETNVMRWSKTITDSRENRGSWGKCGKCGKIKGKRGKGARGSGWGPMFMSCNGDALTAFGQDGRIPSVLGPPFLSSPFPSSRFPLSPCLFFSASVFYVCCVFTTSSQFIASVGLVWGY